MLKRLLQCISTMLVLVMLVNVVPLQALENLPAEAPTTETTPNTEEGKIIGELSNNRDEYTKRFLLDNGNTIAAQYAIPVHYQDSNGDWQQYDNRMAVMDAEAVETDGSEVTYRVIQSDKDIQLSKKASEKKLVTIEKDGHEISWGFSGINKVDVVFTEEDTVYEGNDAFLALEGIVQEARYDNAFPNADLQYYILPTGVKENIVLKNADAQNEFTMEYKFHKLTATQTDSRNITLSDEEGNTVYTITAPTMFDANGVWSNALSISIVEAKNNKLTVKLSVDPQWLQDEQRCFPVTVDPSFSTDKSWNSFDSTMIVSGHPDTSYGYNGDNYMGTVYAGYEPNSSFGKTRTLVKPNALPTLSPGDVIVDAKIWMRQQASSHKIQVTAHRVTEPWEMSTATWNLMSENYVDTVEDYNLTFAGYSTEYNSWTVTELVRKWYEGTEENYGIMLIAPTETSTTMSRVIYYSATYPGPMSTKPALEIEYCSNRGIEDYWTYHRQGLSAGAVGSINDFSGNLVFQVPIMSESGARMPISVNLTYNGYTSDKQFMDGTAGLVTGNGWQMNYNQRCMSVNELTELGSDVITGLKNAGFLHVYIDADGTMHYFKRYLSDYTLADEDGLGLIMKHEHSYNSPYILEYQDGRQLHFNRSNYLYKMVDSDGNTATIEYDGTNIKKITDGAGRVTTFAYEAYGDMTRLTQVTDPAGRATTLTYDGGNLQKVTYPDGTSVQFQYTTVTVNEKQYYLISRVTDMDGTYLEYSYNTSGMPHEATQVTAVQQYAADGTAGNSMAITYNQDNTAEYSYTIGQITTQESYCFDNSGRTVCILNADGSSVYGDYNSGTGRDSNRLIYQAVGAKHIENLLTDSSAENETSGWTIDDGNAQAVSIDTAEHYLGSKSIKIDADQPSYSPSVIASQTISVTPGQTYTFSAYVKTDSIVPYVPGEGAVLTIMFSTSSNSTTYYNSEFIEGTNDWQRIKVTATAPENATTLKVFCGTENAVSGKAWFDCLQLEVGNTMNDYNMLENSSFSGTSGWTNQNQAAGDGITADGHYVMTGEYGQERSADQTVQINRGSTGFTLSAKAQGDSVEVGFDDRTFGLALDVHYENGTVSNHDAQFNVDTTGEQYLSTTFLVPKDKKDLTISYVTFRITYDNNANSAWFDECMLTFDETGTAYTYDENGNVISAADNANRNATYEYNSAQALTETTNSNNESYSYTYDSTYKHRLVSARSNQLGNGFVYSYDSFGNIIGTKMGTVSTYGVLDTSKPYIESTTGYDSTGNYATSVSDQRGNTTTYNINLLTGLTNSITDPSGTTTSYTYDDITLLIEAISSGDSSVSYVYDNFNRLTQIQHNGFTYHFAYDKFGNTSTVKVGDQTLMTNTYGEGNGLLLSETYGNGTVYAYTYDEYGRVIKVSINGTDRYSTVYNAKGQIAEIKDLVNNEKTVYTYDISGRLLKISQSGGKSISTGYDILNRVTAINYQFAGQTQTVTYGYGQDGQKGESTLLSGATQTVEYDSLGREESSTVGGLTRETSYLNVSGKRTTTLPANLTYTQNNNTLLSTSYTYDVRGNIHQMTVDGVTYTYTYDSLNQLTAVETSDNSFTASYSYDNGGNITSKTVNGVTTTYGYDTNWKDKLTSYNGQSISYDGMGNPTVSYNKQFMWTGRQLTLAETIDGTLVGYSYNADGIRTKKTVGSVTTEYFLQGSTILAEKTGNNVIWYIYDTGGELLGFTYNGTPYYYLKNMQGDVYKVVDANGTVVASYTYDPWGKVLTATGSMAEINPIRFRNYYYDIETGFYCISSHYYDPEIGRWINADGFISTEQDITGCNMLTYCDNNPVNRKETTGKFWDAAIKVTAASIACTVASSDYPAQPTSDVGAAQPYIYLPGSQDPSSPNCYSYAIGSPVNEQPGGTSGRIPTMWNDVDDVAISVEEDLKAKGYTVRRISGPDDKVYNNEFKIALQVGTRPAGYNWYTGEPIYDYHFMRQTNTGQWAEKHGIGGESILWPVGMTPDTIPWTLNGKPYYDSGIIYFAIGK